MIKTRWQKAALAGAATLALAACATETPYTSAAESGYGFTEQKIEDGRYRITFRGNSLTDRETVENYLLFRAAELTVDTGHDWFVITEDDTERTTQYRGTAADPFGPFGRYNFYGRGRAFPYYGFGYPWGPGFADVDLRASNRYTAIAYVKMGRGEKPQDEYAAYDARSVMDNIGPRIRRAER